MNTNTTNSKHSSAHKLVYTAGLVCLIAALALSVTSGVSRASSLHATAPGLGAASSFSVLADGSAASANTTTLSGDLGLSTGLASSRTGPWIVGGTEYFGPISLAANARTDAMAAWSNLAGQGSSGTWGLAASPVPGVWTDAGSPSFGGTLTLNGSPTDVWVFQISSDFTFAGAVILSGGARACNVFWQVGRDATIGVGSAFIGTLIAGRDVVVVSGASVDGRTLALRNVTVDANSITGPSCPDLPVITSTETPSSHVSVTNECAADNGRGKVFVGLSAGVIVHGLGADITSAADTGDNKIVVELPVGHYDWNATPPAGHYMVDADHGAVDIGLCNAATSTTTAPVSLVVTTTAPTLLLPVSGSDIADAQALAARQWLYVGLGFLGVSLFVLGFALRRKSSQ